MERGDGDDYVISAELAERLLDGGCLKGRGWGTNDPLFRLEISLSSQRKLRQRIIPRRGMIVRSGRDGMTYMVVQPTGGQPLGLVSLAGHQTGMMGHAPEYFDPGHWSVVDDPTNNNTNTEEKSK